MAPSEYRVVPFQRWHADWLFDDGLSDPTWRIPHEQLRLLEQTNSWTLVWGVDPIGCGGTIEQWPGRHMAWVYLAKRAGRHMPVATRVVLAKLAEVKGRIEMTVRADFEQGHRWAKMLGFHVENPCMKAFGPQGEDHVGYVRHNG